MNKKNYPVHPHDHPYVDSARHIHALEDRNALLTKENARLREENSSLRLLAIHGLIYRLNDLIRTETASCHPRVYRIKRWSDEIGRLMVAHSRIKAEKMSRGGK